MKSELLTIDKKTELLKAIAEKAFAEIVAQTKSANPKDVGTFKMIISDSTMDRQGDMVDQNGFDIENYMKHPVVLWGHDYFSLPIGITDKIYREDNKTIAEGRFAPTEEAQKIRKYYDAGYPVAASVGYIPKDSAEGKVTAAELLEWSFVTVPANANCISADEARIHGLDVEFLTTKGFKFENAKIKEAEEGSACQLDDGTPGVMAKDPGDPDGPMICVPEKSMDKKDNENEEDITNPGKDELDRRLREDIKSEHDMHSQITKTIVGKVHKAIEEFSKEGEKTEYSIEQFKEKAIEEFKKCYKAMESEHARHHGAVANSIEEYCRKMAATDVKNGEEKILSPKKEKLKEIQEHSKAIDEHIKAQQSVISEILKIGDDGEGGEKNKKPSELKSESSGIEKEMTLDDAIKAGNIVKECLRTAVTKAAEALEGIRKAEKRLPAKK